MNIYRQYVIEIIVPDEGDLPEIRDPGDAPSGLELKEVETMGDHIWVFEVETSDPDKLGVLTLLAENFVEGFYDGS